MASRGRSEEGSGECVLTILGYHKIGSPSPGAWDTRFHMPEETFVEHLRWLDEAGWEVIGVSELLAGLASPAALPPRAAVLTFDDGYRSVLEYAAPRMVERGYPGVVFVPAGYVGRSSEWTANFSEAPEPICGWDELRELQEAGISIQSHGFFHLWFSELTPAQIEDELTRSKAVLEDGLGSPVEVFSFPFGDVGRDAAETRASLERSGYRAACTRSKVESRTQLNDAYQLNRLMMFRDTDLAAALATPTPPG